MKKYLYAVLIQSISPGLQFALATIIMRFWGSEVQGFFAAKKALLDLYVVIGSLGFPQSIVLNINHNNISRKTLYNDSIYFSLFLLPIMILTTLFFNLRGANLLLVMTAIPFAALGFILNKLLRAVLLTIDDGIRFHLITIVPAFSTIICTLSWLLFGNYKMTDRLLTSFLTSGVLSIILTISVFPPRLVKKFLNTKINYVILAKDGLDVFFQTILVTLQGYLTTNLIVWNGDLKKAGIVSIGIMIFQAAMLPMQMISPILLNYWSKTNLFNIIKFKSLNFKIILSAALVFFAVIYFSPHILVLFFGEEIKNSTLSIQIFMITTGPAIIRRIGSLYYLAIKRLKLNGILTMISFATFLCSCLIFTLFKNINELSLAITWLIAETVGLLGYIFTFSRLTIIRKI